jgi:predicted glycogen debranching enzyme
VLLSKVEEELWVNGRSYPLSTNEYPGCFHPGGYKYQTSFRLTPFPEWLYAVGGVVIRKKIVPLRGRRAFALCYRLEGFVEDAVLRIVPLIACRGFHEINSRAGTFEIEGGVVPQEVVVRGGERRLAVHLSRSGGEFEEMPLWFHRVTYRREIERGFDGEEELFSPGAFVVSIDKRMPFTLTVGCESLPPADFVAEDARERQRLTNLLAATAPKTELERWLTLAADAFTVRPGGPTEGAIVAGYPWFDCWGRDALIALEGLTLLTGRFDDARAVLLTLANRVKNGLVPNFLAADPQDDAFNSIDASLWFAHAVCRYHAYTGDDATVREHLWPTIAQIIEAYLAGTLFGIRIGADGLLTGGDHQTQLTWMDATVRGQPVTSRHGKAVEVNALWYNALRSAASLAGRLGLSAQQQQYLELANRAQNAFGTTFWNEEDRSLYDCVAEDVPDRRLRPNQILAIGLPYPVLERSRWQEVLSAVQKHLHTSYGLRTLAPSETEYRASYSGGPEERDSAYHQGTIWPWLLGSFYEAYLKTYGFSQVARTSVAEAMSSWSGHLLGAGLGTVSEIFDAEAPHQARGSIAQAWSVAELLRVSRIVQSEPREEAAPKR